VELTGFAQIHAIGAPVSLFAGAGVVLLAQLTSPLWTRSGAARPETHRSPSLGLALLAIAVAAAWTLWHAQTGSAGAVLDGAVVIDRFALFFTFLLTSVAAAVAIVAREWTASLDDEQAADFYALLLVSTGAMVLMAQANDLIAIFVALETTSIAQFVMAGIGRDGRSAEAGLKYLLTGAVAAAVLLYGFVFLFGVAGTTSLGGIAEVVQAGDEGIKLALLLGFALVIAGLGFKMALVPSHGWVPDVYQGAPPPVASFLSVASKAAGFAVMLRILYSGLGGGGTFISGEWAVMLGVLAAASMTAGNLGAFWQSDVRRLLGYSSIAQAGNIAIGLAAVAAGSTLGPSAVLFFLGTYAVTNLGVFFVVIAVGQRTGSYELAEYVGLARRSPLLAGVLGLCLLSLTGIPPTAGFLAKLYIFNAAVQAEQAWLVALVAVGVLNTAISAFYYLRWAGLLVQAPEAAEEGAPAARRGSLLPTVPTQAMIALAAAGVLILGLLPTPLLSAARRAAEVLIPIAS
jgi:NADH-quinone oxidoreductase subunit N